MQEIVERYLAAWNETDASRRRKLVDELWAEDGSYTDPLAIYLNTLSPMGATNSTSFVTPKLTQ